MYAQGKSGSAPRQTFRKIERITGKKEVSELFESGSNFFISPLKVCFLPLQGLQNYHKLLVAVPKKHLAKATARNLIKRRIREAYRKNKAILYDPSFKTKLKIACIYNTNEVKPLREIEKKIVIILHRLLRVIEDYDQKDKYQT